MQRIIEYFDLVSDVRSQGAAEAVSPGKKLHWIPQWFALFLGILIQPSFDHFRQTHEWAFDGFSGWALFSLIVAAMIFPGVYKNSFDPEKPIFIQVLPIFTSGMGWESLLEAAKTTAGG